MVPVKIEDLIRKNIKELIPYSSARDEYSGNDAVLMDANENPFNAPFNRYPDPLQREVKQKISRILNVNSNTIFLGNGSDEAIDLLIRAFCTPGTDNIIITDPTYGMYEVCARINDIEVKKTLLNPDFSLNSENVLKSTDVNSKIIFLCSPNNPTSNLLDQSQVLKIIETFKGLVVMDEAYIDFSGSRGLLDFIGKYPHLIVLRTFSKAWGLAGIRLGMAFASAEIISVLNKIKYPYNVNALTQKAALQSLDKIEMKKKWVRSVIKERVRMESQLSELGMTVYHSDANFLLVKFTDAGKLFEYLKDHKIIVRDRSKVSLCKDCLRITVGNRSENRKLLKYIRKYVQSD
mgnify:CR=1 FL=1